jgi:hypothetical protein
MKIVNMDNVSKIERGSDFLTGSLVSARGHIDTNQPPGLLYTIEFLSCQANKLRKRSLSCSIP